MNKRIYFFYILIAVLCPMVMAIYYINDVACIHAVRSETIAAILSTCAAILAFSEYRGARKPVGHWLSASIPLIGIPLIPVAMIIHIGFETFLTERIIAFTTMEVFALAQFIVAVLMFRGLIFKRGTDKQKMPRIGFAIMKTVLTLRSLFKKPERILREMGLQKGQTVLDYGCGIGSFSIPAAKMVGDDGVVYALDIHPRAIRTVEKEIKKKRISNIKPILSARETGLPDGCVDVVLLYDVFQMISDKDKLLEELHRVLKSDGFLFATAEHLDSDEFMNIFARGNLFTLIEQKGEVFRFKRD